MVNLHIRLGTSDNQWISALEIPLQDIERLSCRPLKWLRFVAFAALGAKGDLFDASGAERNIVNYEADSLTDLAERYYFVPDGPYHLVDHDGLPAHITSSAATQRRTTFRGDVARRDGNFCVITRHPGSRCHATHIIPHSKGNEYIRFVILDRQCLYEDNIQRDIDIDATENGMLLRRDIHELFDQGLCAFLRTPNFALDPADIPRVEPGEMPASRTTIQHIETWSDLDPFPQRDVRADWAVPDAPPSILLDYMYGVAVIKHWATADVQNLLNDRHNTYSALPPNMPSSIPDDDDCDNGHVRSDDSKDTDYVPPRAARHHGIRRKHKDSERCRDMDTAFAFSMLFRGYPPGTTFAMIRQKQEEEAEMRSRQVAREKVQGWLETDYI